MNARKVLIASLVVIVAVCGAILQTSYFDVRTKAYAGLVGAGAGALLAYILRPHSIEESLPLKPDADGDPAVNTVESPRKNP